MKIRTYSDKRAKSRFDIFILKKFQPVKVGILAGETRFEHATDGFGDRDSTVELLP